MNASRKTADPGGLAALIKFGCQRSPAEWGCVLVRSESGWYPDLTVGLSKKLKIQLDEVIGQRTILRWLEETAELGNSRYKKSGGELGVGRMYLFPGPTSTRQLLIGAGSLSKVDKEFFGELASRIYSELPAESFGEIPAGQSAIAGGASLSLSESLGGMLEIVCRAMQADAGYLAVLAGEQLRVKGVRGLENELFGIAIEVNSHSHFSEVITRKKVIQLTPGEDADPDFSSIRSGENHNYQLIIPVVAGNRVTAVVGLMRPEPFSTDERKKAEAIGSHIAPPVEKSMLGMEAAYYLQRFALLNELASFASSGLDLPRVVQRGQAVLLRAFDADAAHIWLCDDDRIGLLSFVEGDNGQITRRMLKGGAIEKSVVEIGQPIRIDETTDSDEQGSRLVVPMRFRGAVIGVVSLQSHSPAAFSEQDEKYLAVVASQLASIITSIRLNTEMRLRALAMKNVNDIVQEIVDLRNIPEITRQTARLLAEKFEHEMVLVMRVDAQLDEFIAEGVAGSQVQDVPHGFRFSKGLGIPSEVARDGVSILLSDVRSAPNYVPIPGWDPGSGMWVPLRAGTEIIGVISVESREINNLDDNDLAVLEAVAGILSSVLTNASQYDQLKESVSQLAAVRETALDVGADLDLDTLLKRVVNRVRVMLDAHGAELGFVDRENQVVEVLVSENPWQDYSGYRFKFNDGVTGQVAAAGEGIAIADFNSWGGRVDSVFKAPFSTVAGVPLKLMGEVIGTLVVQDDRPARAFNNTDLKTLELLAPLLAIFIRNARLYQELELRMEAQRLAEERLVRSAKLAAVGEIAAAVAHELNNPLTTVTGFSELVRDALPEDAPERKDVDLVLAEAQRARTIIRRLLDFSRQSELLRVDTDLNEIITMVVQMIHHMAQTANIEVQMALWGDIPTVRVDRNQIQQVLLNLLHNGIQAMPDGGKLLVETLVEHREDLRWLGIRVTDTGMGIAEEDLAKIFEPFFTTKPTGQGTGLGLSVSYSIISEHGGYIDVSSQVGEGSVFTIWLPVQREDEDTRAYD